MAKTYSKSEMTPDLLQLNLQYFFNGPVRKYQQGIDEITLSTECDEERWLKIMNHWFDFVENPPVESTELRNIAENLAKTATEHNIETVLDIFEDLAGFMSSITNSSDEKTAAIVKEVEKLNDALYDDAATEERKVKIKLLEEQRTLEDKKQEDLFEAVKQKTTEQKAIEELQNQIAKLSETIENLTDGSNNSDSSSVNEAKIHVSEAWKNAVAIADMMESDIKEAREAEEIKKQEELVRRADEKADFEQKWDLYAQKYTGTDEDPTADLFKKFLIDVADLEPNQVDEIAISAIFYGGEIDNFLEFDEELCRVKNKKS